MSVPSSKVIWHRDCSGAPSPGRTTHTGRPGGGAGASGSPPMATRAAAIVSGGAGCHRPSTPVQPSSIPQPSVATPRRWHRQGPDGAVRMAAMAPIVNPGLRRPAAPTGCRLDPSGSVRRRGLPGPHCRTHPVRLTRRLGLHDCRRDGCARRTLDMARDPRPARGGHHRRHPLCDEVVEARHALDRGLAGHAPRWCRDERGVPRSRSPTAATRRTFRSPT